MFLSWCIANHNSKIVLFEAPVADSNPYSVNVISRFFAGPLLSRSATTATTIVIRIQGFRQTSPRLRWSRGWSVNSVSFERLSRDRSLSLHARAIGADARIYIRGHLIWLAASILIARSCDRTDSLSPPYFDSDRDALWGVLTSLRWLPVVLILQWIYFIEPCLIYRTVAKFNIIKHFFFNLHL